MTLPSVSARKMLRTAMGQRHSLTWYGSAGNRRLDIVCTRASGYGKIDISSASEIELTGLDVSMTKTSGTSRGFVWRTGTLVRWQMASSSSAETGFEAGSDLVFARFSDAGAYNGLVMTLNRTFGTIDVHQGLVLAAVALPGAPRDGQLIRDVADGKVKCWSNGVWNNLF